MSYEITYACGHSETVQISGSSNEEIESKIKYREEHGLCKKCCVQKKEDQLRKRYPDLPEIQADSEWKKSSAQKIRQCVLNSLRGRICAAIDQLIGTQTPDGEEITEEWLRDHLRLPIELKCLSQYKIYKDLLKKDTAKDVLNTAHKLDARAFM